MYVIKNALRCIVRSKGRNILIGIIALVIAVSACIGLSIRQAAENAKSTALDGMSVTATISYNRLDAMGQIGGGRPTGGSGGGMPSFDKDMFAELMGSVSSLTLDEYKKYAQAESVKDFYYTLTAYFDGSESFSPVTTDSSSSSSSGSGRPLPGGFDFGGRGGASGDFTVIGYSGDNAMTDFVNGICTIPEENGSMFDEGTTELFCIISEELSYYNSLAVGDTVILTNPSLSTETYTLTVCGIYTTSESSDFSFSTSQDPANRIYMSYNALQLILDASSSASTTVTDGNGNSKESKVTGSINATYTFANTDDYELFEDQARALGLSDSYTVSSSDLAEFENSLAPLKTLSSMAGWFLLVILLIGGIILVVLNIFNVRERKYEVGVLTAMGMKKWKVASQFICEILVITMIAVLIGAGIGAVSSLPITNALLESQAAAQSSQKNQIDGNFGRPTNMGGGMPDMGGGMPSGMPDMGGGKNPFGNMFGSAANYITEVNSAMDLTVVFQMLGVGLLLTLIASAASVLFIMRYDPLKILSSRD